MALVTFAGFPASGKSTRARELEEFLQTKLATSAPALARLKVVVVSDQGLELSRSTYDDSRAEKPTRAKYYAAVIRAMGKHTIVIADNMNYIKGSRYQMYCQAREIGVRTCTVFVATPPDKCNEWNQRRPEGSRYLQSTLDNLISRFEEPNSAARWDSPLVTIPCDDPPVAEGNPLAEEIWVNCTQSFVKPPNVATIPIATSSTSYLTLLESTCSTIISTLLARQALSPLTTPTPLPLPTSPPCTLTVQLGRPATLAVCSRLKKQFTKMNMQMGKEFPVEVVARLFAEYLESNVR